MFDNWGDMGRNMVLEFDDFYLSYNPCTSDFFLIGGGGREETAVMFRNDRLQLILNGDHRAALEAIGNNPEGVIRYYKYNPASHSEFTVDRDDVLEETYDA